MIHEHKSKIIIGFLHVVKSFFGYIPYMLMLFLWIAIFGVLLLVLEPIIGNTSLYTLLYNNIFLDAAATSRDPYFEMNYSFIFTISAIIMAFFSVFRRKKTLSINKEVINIVLFNIMIVIFGIIVFTFGYINEVLYLEAYLGVSVTLVGFTFFFTCTEVLFLYMLHFFTHLSKQESSTNLSQSIVNTIVSKLNIPK